MEKFIFLVIFIFSFFISPVFAGETCASLKAAGMDPSLANYAQAVSKSEGNFGTINQANCVGAFQFCPGTLERFYTGGRQNFANDPSAQVSAFNAYEKEQNATANRQGYYSSVGTEISVTGKNGVTKTGTITDSSILFACQFGCGKGGKLDNFIKNGYQCIPNKPGSISSPTNDGNGLCVGEYLIRGSGYDVSSITGRKDAASGAGGADCTGPAQVPSTKKPSLDSPKLQPSVPNSLSKVPYIPKPSDSAGSGMSIGDASQCFICDAVLETLAVVDKLISKAIQPLSMSLLPLFIAALVLSLLYNIILDVIRGSFWGTRFLKTLFRGAVVGLLLTNLSSGGTVVSDTFISPVLELGSGIGKGIADTAGPSVGLNATVASTESGQGTGSNGCLHKDVNSVGLTSLLPAATTVIAVTCVVHKGLSIGLTMGATIFIQKTSIWPISRFIFSFVFSALGAALILISLMAMLSFGTSILESLLKIGIVASLFPILAISWVFSSSRPSAMNALYMIFYTFISLVFSGLGAILTSYCVIMACGLGLNLGVNASPDQIISAFTNLAQTIDFSVASLSAFAKCAAFTVAGFLAAGHMMKSANAIAAQLTQYAGAEAGEMSKAVSGSVMGLGSTLITAGIGIPALGAKGLGGIAGKMTGRAVLGASASTVANTVSGNNSVGKAVRTVFK